jgi:hypothetical protein
MKGEYFSDYYLLKKDSVPCNSLKSLRIILKYILRNWCSMNWIHLVHSRIQRRALVNTVMNNEPWDSTNDGDFLDQLGYY